jgi:uncharacterized protein (TIGR00299 family) protein
VTLLYLEPFGGMAGDMLLAALLDLGDERFTLADLRGLGESLLPGSCEITTERVLRGGLRALHLRLSTPESDEAPERHFADLKRLLEQAALPDTVRARCLAALWKLAEAEARVHDTTPERIHFHEIGAVDTLVDLCGAALALERLGVERLVSSAPITGTGTLRCAHGLMPVPPPAVCELLKGKPMRVEGGPGERLTPTAAAVLATWVDAFEAPGSFTADAVGYGAGTRELQQGPPNLLRVQLGRVVEEATSAEAWLLEVNLDDMSGEEIGFAVARLREAGALEVWTSALSMKKDRPGVLVSALAREEQRNALEAAVFEATTSLGLRWRRVDRRECAREELVVEIHGRSVRVKRRIRPAYPGRSPDGERDLSPEFDDLEALARATGMTLREAGELAVRAVLDRLGSEA